MPHIFNKPAPGADDKERLINLENSMGASVDCYDKMQNTLEEISNKIQSISSTNDKIIMRLETEIDNNKRMSDTYMTKADFDSKFLRLELNTEKRINRLLIWVSGGTIGVIGAFCFWVYTEILSKLPIT